MKLVLVAHRCRTPLEIAYVGVVIGNDERPFELSCPGRVDAEIGAKLHGTAHSLWYVDERAVGEHRRVQRSVEIVAVAYHRAEISPHQFGIVLHSLREGAENHAQFGEPFPVCGLHAHRVEHRIDRHSRKTLLLLERDTQFVECLYQFRVHLVHALFQLLLSGCRIVADCLEVDGGYVEVRPAGRGECEPVAECL